MRACGCTCVCTRARATNSEEKSQCAVCEQVSAVKQRTHTYSDDTRVLFLGRRFFAVAAVVVVLCARSAPDYLDRAG